MKHLLLLLFALCASLATKAQVFSSELRVNPAKNTVKVTFTNVTNDTVNIFLISELLHGPLDAQGLWLDYPKRGWWNYYSFWREMMASKRIIPLPPNDAYNFICDNAYIAEGENCPPRKAYLKIVYFIKGRRGIKHYTKEFPPHTWIIE